MSQSSGMDRVDYLIAKREQAIRKARRDFWCFCQLMYPEFYKPSRTYLKDLCQTLQAFYTGDIDKTILVINMPPRHGKTFTARLFVLWMFGQNSKTKIITGSYNQILSSLFAQQTRDGIMSENVGVKNLYFNDVFPNTKIKQGDAAKGFWSLDGSEEKNYLATSPGGTSTGIGANFVIVDDIIKGDEEAYNELAKQKHWEWYNNTLVQRMERPRKQILIMTRWATDDLVGRMLEGNPDECHVITHKAVQPDGTMLCDEIMTYKEYLGVIKHMGDDIASANYQQEPIDKKGRMYQHLKTYDRLPMDTEGNPLFDARKNYTDTADTGADYLCSIDYIVYDMEAYIIDVLYTKDSMETTEKAQAEMMFNDKIGLADIESNNGGRSYARSVERILKEEYGSNATVFHSFHQSNNKQSRINSQSPWVMKHIYFPANWNHRWPEFYKAVTRYQKEGKNAHDDAPDALTGIAEHANEMDIFSFE